ncbi:TPA: hypothetical protein ACF3SG_001478, partial [Enterococcus faecium]
KGFQGVFSIFFYTKKMLVKFTNIKKYRAERSCDRSEQLQGAATRLLSQLLFSMPMKRPLDKNELFFGLFAILC